MYTGWNSTGRRGARRKARTVIDSMPAAAASRRPVRERPPSMKYSIEHAAAISCGHVLAEHQPNTARCP
jgi:hypothetical protein